VSNAAGFWFTGGDQMRIVRLLLEEQQESPLLQLIRARYAAGAVIGGTSAGAAVQSASMITGGDSFTALMEPNPVAYDSIEEQESGHLSMTAGLGFLATGLVDQHFDRKARLGRLVRALALSGEGIGYGIDENTAMVVDGAGRRAEVIGTGTVTLLDATTAVFDWEGQQLARGITLSLFPSGSSFDPATGAALQVRGQGTIGEEYFRHEVRAGGGMAFANQTLEQILGTDLLDNAANQSLERWSVDASGRSLIFHFQQTQSSRGYWDGAGGSSRYTVTGVELHIEKRRLLTEPLPAQSPAR
jgi:cyanophycinase